MINECFIGKNITLDIILNALYVNNKKMMLNIAQVNWQKLINLEILCHLTVFIFISYVIVLSRIKKAIFFQDTGHIVAAHTYVTFTHKPYDLHVNFTS